MLFQATLTIPANTTEKSPTTQTLGISRGIITKFMIRPRPGHSGLAHCVVRFHENIIAPSTEGMSFSGDTFPIDWEDYFEVYQRPYELKIQGWNESTTYEHSFDIYVVVLPRRGIIATAVSDTIKSMFGLIGPRKVT